MNHYYHSFPGPLISCPNVQLNARTLRLVAAVSASVNAEMKAGKRQLSLGVAQLDGLPSGKLR